MDRVSSLPEELLCHVLSFLTTKEAALTSILSKRWRYLFAFVPNLEFDNSVFLHDPEESNWKKKEIRESFVDFVDRVLALQGDSTIDKFSLKCKTGDSDRVFQWICNVLQRGVLYVDLSIDLGEERRCLFLETFMSKTLVELKLGSGCGISFRPGLISLPRLKTLTLVDSVLSDSGQLQMLLSACPALEALDLTNVRWWYNAKATVSSESLKTLTIGSANPLKTLSFDTPNLICLNHSALVSKDYPLVNLEKLVEAHIKLDHGLSLYGNVPKLLSGICSVQKLYLSPGTLEVLGLCCEAMPVFNNLKFLDIESKMSISWKAMPVLLKNCPHLETLVIKGGLVHCVTEYCGDACNCNSRKEKCHSVTSCPVKRLEIGEFQGRSREMDMIKHFLDYFPCLKEIEIYVKYGRPEHLTPITFDSPYNHLSGRNVEIKVHDSLT